MRSPEEVESLSIPFTIPVPYAPWCTPAPWSIWEWHRVQGAHSILLPPGARRFGGVHRGDHRELRGAVDAREGFLCRWISGKIGSRERKQWERDTDSPFDHNQSRINSSLIFWRGQLCGKMTWLEQCRLINLIVDPYMIPSWNFPFLSMVCKQGKTS